MYQSKRCSEILNLQQLAVIIYQLCAWLLCCYELADIVTYCKTVFFACPLFREFRDPDEFAKVTGREYIF